MARFEPPDPNFEARVRASFARQSAMALIGARLGGVRPGEVEIELAYREDLTQQHGFIHGGIVGMIADSASGYAAFSLMPAEASVLTVEYKLNLLAPAEGEILIARGRVLRPGRTLVVAEARVAALRAGKEVVIAASLSTLMTLAGRTDGPKVTDGGRPSPNPGLRSARRSR
ncbi:MAG TPA: PaaI family thioesterase [Alphaproteobacteria bacterium]|nr:PaaI family thioesterase [Alphaproteobacteria bacterium]